jgi:hypothetical protein
MRQMQINEYNVKTTEAMARAYDGFKFRSFKHFTPVNFPPCELAICVIVISEV